MMEHAPSILQKQTKQVKPKQLKTMCTQGHGGVPTYPNADVTIRTPATASMTPSCAVGTEVSMHMKL